MLSLYHPFLYLYLSYCTHTWGKVYDIYLNERSDGATKWEEFYHQRCSIKNKHRKIVCNFGYFDYIVGLGMHLLYVGDSLASTTSRPDVWEFMILRGSILWLLFGCILNLEGIFSCEKLHQCDPLATPSHPADKYPLQWRHNGRDCVSNHQPHNCLLNRLLGLRSK